MILWDDFIYILIAFSFLFKLIKKISDFKFSATTEWEPLKRERGSQKL